MSGSAAGQQTSDNSCPTISVSGPPNVVKPGEIATYTARIDTKGLNITPSYKWTASSGTIVSGQGTETMELRKADWTTTVSLEVQGLPLGCPNVQSDTDIIDLAPQPSKIAEFFGPLTKADFSGLVQAAKREPTSQLFVLISGPTHRPAPAIAAKRNLILSKVGSKLGGATRVTFVDSTRKDDRATFWLVPPGATSP